MEIIHKMMACIIFATMTCYSQGDVKTISFNFDPTIYSAVAKDSLNQIYRKQKEFCNQNPDDKDRNLRISNSYKFADLEIFSIPQFRISREAKDRFVCGKNIEYFIQWEEKNKYQFIILSVKGKPLGELTLPDFSYEMERIYNPDYETGMYKENPNYYIDRLNLKDINDQLENILISRPENYYFMIFGIRDAVFEIDPKGTVFGNWLGTGENHSRMPINEFIVKHVGVSQIQEIAKGNYLDLYEAIAAYKECTVPVKTNVSVIVNKQK